MRYGLTTSFVMAFGHGLRLDALAAPGYRGVSHLEERLLICNNVVQNQTNNQHGRDFASAGILHSLESAASG